MYTNVYTTNIIIITWSCKIGCIDIKSVSSIWAERAEHDRFGPTCYWLLLIAIRNCPNTPIPFALRILVYIRPFRIDDNSHGVSLEGSAFQFSWGFIGRFCIPIANEVSVPEYAEMSKLPEIVDRFTAYFSVINYIMQTHAKVSFWIYLLVCFPFIHNGIALMSIHP